MRSKWILFIPAVGIVSGSWIGAEFGYRRHVEARLQSLEADLLAAHPHASKVKGRYFRFRRETSSPPPCSLTEDAWEALRGVLDLEPARKDGCISYTYLGVLLGLKHRALEEWDEPHGLLWSPRLLRFVPWSGCDQPGCPCYSTEEAERRRRDRTPG